MVITGTPGAGKSEFSRELSKRAHATIVEINEVVERQRLYSGLDKFGSKIVKLKELEKAIKEKIKQLEGLILVVGHLGADIKVGADITVVLRLNLNTLIERLKSRDYPKEKIRENLISEVVDYCGLRSKDKCKEVYEVEHEREKKQVIAYIIDSYKGTGSEKPHGEEIDKLKELLDLVALENEYGL